VLFRISSAWSPDASGYSCCRWYSRGFGSVGVAPVGGDGMLRDVYVTWGHSLSAGIWVMHFLHLLVEWLARVKTKSVWIMPQAPGL
jgi:hypothetical protein